MKDGSWESETVRLREDETERLRVGDCGSEMRLRYFETRYETYSDE